MEKIYTAKTEDAAKEQAVNEFAACGIEESDIEFEILERPVKKLFGMKGEFKVRAFAAEPVKAAAEEEAPAAFDEEERRAGGRCAREPAPRDRAYARDRRDAAGLYDLRQLRPDEAV